jgi:hypothetical protein
MQYCSVTGQVEHCQVGVFLSSVTARGHTLIDRELYLPLDWIEDPARGLAAGIPQTVRFQTKPEQAVRMIERIKGAQIPISWVVTDTVPYGQRSCLCQLAPESAPLPTRSSGNQPAPQPFSICSTILPMRVRTSMDDSLLTRRVAQERIPLAGGFSSPLTSGRCVYTIDIQRISHGKNV